MHLVQKATQVAKEWSVSEQDTLDILNGFTHEYDHLLEEYNSNPNPENEKRVLDELSNYACDYLFRVTLSYL